MARSCPRDKNARDAIHCEGSWLGPQSHVERPSPNESGLGKVLPMAYQLDDTNCRDLYQDHERRQGRWLRSAAMMGGNRGRKDLGRSQ